MLFFYHISEDWIETSRWAERSERQTYINKRERPRQRKTHRETGCGLVIRIIMKRSIDRDGVNDRYILCRLAKGQNHKTVSTDHSF